MFLTYIGMYKGQQVWVNWLSTGNNKCHNDKKKLLKCSTSETLVECEVLRGKISSTLEKGKCRIIHLYIRRIIYKIIGSNKRE